MAMKELMIIITQTMMAIIDESVEVFLCFFMMIVIIFQSWAANIIKSKFEDPITSEDLKDHFMRGEWEVFHLQ